MLAFPPLSSGFVYWFAPVGLPCSPTAYTNRIAAPGTWNQLVPIGQPSLYTNRIAAPGTHICSTFSSPVRSALSAHRDAWLYLSAFRARRSPGVGAGWEVDTQRSRTPEEARPG